MSTSSTTPHRRRDVVLNALVPIIMIGSLATPIVAAVLGGLAASGQGGGAMAGSVLAAGWDAADPPPGYAESGEAQETLLAVIGNVRNVIMGLLAALATLLLTIAGVRYLMGGGDPGETEKAKSGLKAAAIGYGLAVLAPALAALLSYVVTFR